MVRTYFMETNHRSKSNFVLNVVLCHSTYEGQTSKFISIKSISADIMFDTPDIRWPGNIILMVADVLVPNRHQAISNHHADLTILSHEFKRGWEVGNPMISLLLLSLHSYSYKL